MKKDFYSCFLVSLFIGGLLLWNFPSKKISLNLEIIFLFHKKIYIQFYAALYGNVFSLWNLLGTYVLYKLLINSLLLEEHSLGSNVDLVS